VTLHPSALLRVVDRDEGEAAFLKWVEDLTAATRYVSRIEPRR